jgi:hypothetical protein
MPRPLHNIRWAPGDEWAYVANRILCPVTLPAAIGPIVAGMDFVSASVGSTGFDVYTPSSGEFDVIRTVAHLRALGYPAQPDHALFLHGGCGCGCPPHPAHVWPDECGSDAHDVAVNPRSKVNARLNPRSKVNARLNPRSKVNQGSSARPTLQPSAFNPGPHIAREFRVTVLDTGVEAQRTGIAQMLYESALVTGDPDFPDSTPRDHFLDTCAGHGTFIAGVIAQHALGCRIQVHSLADPYGVVSESDVMVAIEAESTKPKMAERDDERPPHYLNLSFGGRSWDDQIMAGLQAAISSAQLAGIVVVASAGNDGDCHPTYPAALPGVVSVGAIGPDGPAEFTNYGPWVRCCAPGVDVVSTFFTFDGAEPPGPGGDPDAFSGWACWSGTSFSTPAVIGALIREQLLSQCTPQQSVQRIIDAPGLLRIPGLGTVVNI